MGWLLVVITAFLAFGPLAATAQEATPATAEPAAGLAPNRTDTRYVVPFTRDGLNPGLTVTSTIEGACPFGSSIANGRPDAWGCTTDGGVVDPCFENAYLPVDEATEVACFDTPWSGEVVVLRLTAPLSREKEGPGGGPSGAADTAEEVIQPWDLPWALELENGDRCSLMHGTLVVMAGQVAHYGCENGGVILGETDRSQPVWTVSYLAEGEVASHLVDVLTAWT
ncbi:MAG: hypothetical protein AVDCRST_MAG59-5150 [uncultured Thermomicrobiales bacterium]|uniref:Uncharacterized protein n=1 Tax=uncultured Thermomicrobiales bacterium TaxID=1645740 RepID=A0A6J4VPI0_9BACT|nr:MAG: hypothetical protein AVDCRST_MAG59-5150 [uncultured Thermomicrobiales bacterium]